MHEQILLLFLVFSVRMKIVEILLKISSVWIAFFFHFQANIKKTVDVKIKKLKTKKCYEILPDCHQSPLTIHCALLCHQSPR